MTDFNLNEVLRGAEKLVKDVERVVSEGMKHQDKDERIKSVNTNIALSLNALKQCLGHGNKASK